MTYGNKTWTVLEDLKSRLRTVNEGYLRSVYGRLHRDTNGLVTECGYIVL